MAEEGSKKAFLKKILPRVFKAALAGIISYLFIYCLSMIVPPFEAMLPWYEPLTQVFMILFIFFVVVTELSSGTVLHFAFSVARALVLMIYFIYALNGGIVTLTLPADVGNVHIVADLRVFLAMVISATLLGLAKNVLQAINFLFEKQHK